MQTISAELISTLQTAVGPVILISGVGLLLLSMTNRYGRTIDRVRGLCNLDPSRREQAKSQMTILYERAKVLRFAILFVSTSALCASLLIITLFLGGYLKINLGWLIGSLFILAMLFLIFSLLLFILDVNKSLEALRLELKPKNTEKAD